MITALPRPTKLQAAAPLVGALLGSTQLGLAALEGGSESLLQGQLLPTLCSVTALVLAGSWLAKPGGWTRSESNITSFLCIAAMMMRQGGCCACSGPKEHGITPCKWLPACSEEVVEPPVAPAAGSAASHAQPSQAAVSGVSTEEVWAAAWRPLEQQQQQQQPVLTARGSSRAASQPPPAVKRQRPRLMLQVRVCAGDRLADDIGEGHCRTPCSCCCLCHRDAGSSARPGGCTANGRWSDCLL